MKRLLSVLVFLFSVATLSGCGSNGSSAAPPPDLTATAGDGRVTLTWTMEPGVQYWVYYAPAASISVDNWTLIPGSHALVDVSSPLTIGGLVNGTTYAFTMDARRNQGPRGAGAPSVAAVPRLAGGVWTAGSGGGTADLAGVTFGTVGTTIEFAAVGAGGTILTSTDGLTWNSVTQSATTANLNAVCYGGSAFVAAGAGGVVLYSTDLATWTAETSATASAVNGVATAGSNHFVAIGAGGAATYSTDGVTWTAATSGTANDLLGVTFGNALYVAVGAGGTILTSPDGVTWTAQTSNTTANLTSVAWGIDSSTTTYRFVAVGAGGTLLTSTDGVTWTALTALPIGNINSVTYGTQFILVGDGGVIYSSTTGTSWQAESSGTTSNLAAIARTGYSYVAVGAGGTHLLSQ
ncbi:MAG TPA: hypothetical protein VMC81_04540 [Rhodocyclaceae bacterium]|nr:hypothetical protein [Rhodocyclaceae bacterium]HVO22137.1 hypothetical protein [Candidatus Margulisiibacteriota bacterium]